jgi:hypothetical protein
VPDLVAPWVRSCRVPSRPERSTHASRKRGDIPVSSSRRMTSKARRLPARSMVLAGEQGWFAFGVRLLGRAGSRAAWAGQSRIERAGRTPLAVRSPPVSCPSAVCAGGAGPRGVPAAVVMVTSTVPVPAEGATVVSDNDVPL